ncbi:acyltransferase family protein, partial [Echinicola sediminis]
LAIVKLLNELHVGVTIFFLLSGFILTYKYLLKDGLSYTRYLWNRFTKIFPLYFLLTSLTYGITSWYYQQFTSLKFLELFLNLTLLKSFFIDYIFTGIAQTWTLTVEECFYIASPLMALILFKNPKKRLLTLPLMIISIGIMLMYLGQLILPAGFIPSLRFLFNFSFFGRIFEFVVGMVLAKLFMDEKYRSNKHFTLTGCLGILLSIYLLSSIANYPQTGDHDWLGIIINNALLPIIGIAPLIWGLLNEKTWLGHFLSSPPLQVLGKSSYAFYLIHIGIFQEYLFLHIPSLFTLLLLLYLLSFFLYYCVETPLKKRLRNLI